MEQDQAIFLLNVTLPALKNEQRLTKIIIEAIPVDKGDYRPDPISKTALELAWHIVAAEHRFLSGIADGAFDFNPRHRPERIANPVELVAMYAEESAADTARLEQLTAAQLTKMLDFRGMFQRPAVTYLEFLMHHSVHHRGQLSMYLRPTGARIPAIYGESYDSAEARKAAAGNA
jgi:uncharacterized damage-inducible protein DinB